MKRQITTAISAIAVSLLLAGCAGGELERAESVNPAGSAFGNALYAGYLSLAKSEFGEGDYKDSDEFAIRAQQAAHGQTVHPEALSERLLPQASADDLKSARQLLVGALDGGARSKAPVNAARAQVMFDCWMQEQEENFQPEDIALCRSAFRKEMAVIDSKLAPPPVAERASPAPKPAPPAPRFVVYFPLGSANLTDESLEVISNAAAAARKVGAKGLFIGGHTDRSGEDGFNDKLSEKRANAVAQAIRRGGLLSKGLSLGFFGESKPAIVTEDGVSSRENRRVEIEIRK